MLHAGCEKYLCGFSSFALKRAHKIVKSHHVKLRAKTDVTKTRADDNISALLNIKCAHNAHTVLQNILKIKIVLHAELIFSCVPLSASTRLMYTSKHGPHATPQTMLPLWMLEKWHFAQKGRN